MSIYRPVLLPGVFGVDVYSLLFVLLSVSISRPVLLPGVFDVDVYSYVCPVVCEYTQACITPWCI